jgi:UDPglucose 6-dehydrogenase
MCCDTKYKDGEGYSLQELVKYCSAIFICVPTPSKETGEGDTSMLELVLNSLTELKYSGVVICKSTATPSWYIEAERRFPLKLAHVPEFLTQNNATSDYLNQERVIIGVEPQYRELVYQSVVGVSSLRNRPSTLQVEYCSVGEAAMFKYVANTMLAMKVIINNEFSDFCEAIGVDYEVVSTIASKDDRLGVTHWKVPGPDGKRGYGGACFPKDTNALLFDSELMKVDLSMLRAAILKNELIR